VSLLRGPCRDLPQWEAQERFSSSS
jgi:hypothetical protein